MNASYLRYMLNEIALSGDPDKVETYAVEAYVRRLVAEAAQAAPEPAPVRIPRPYVRIRRGAAMSGRTDRNRASKRHDPALTEASPDADRAAMCAGKERFASGALAVRVSRRRKYKTGGVYRCEHCAGFHLGRRMRTRNP